MPLTMVGREFDEGRYGEWSYGGKPAVPPLGGGTRQPAPVEATRAPELGPSNVPFLVRPSTIPDLGRSPIPPLTEPQQIPEPVA